ncbi:prepilin peptidase [Clostridiaceae bacterium UIB06]|nr:prepilin peptidase [Clostridiaceae bacterium UIB06]
MQLHYRSYWKIYIAAVGEWMASDLIYKILILIIIAIGIISSYTDIKKGKIYNKHLVMFFIPGIIFQVFYMSSKNGVTVKLYLINLIAATFFAILAYSFKIWAAGDAKLVILIISLMPMEIYRASLKNIFPGFSVIMYIFLCGFLYLIIESIFLYIRDKLLHREDMDIKQRDLQGLKKLILKIIYAWIISINLNYIVSHCFKEFYFYNLGLYMIANALLIIYLTKYIGNKKVLYSVVILGSLIYVFNITYFGRGNVHLNGRLMILVLALILFRSLCGKYNYKKVAIEDLKSGMILSAGTVINFFNSKVKGLPANCSESTDSRLTEEQIESIKRWQKSKNGLNEVVVVRQIHFAPFIFLGTIISLILGS